MNNEEKYIDEMLPCPFCGGEAALKNYNTSGLWMISCLNNCGVLMAAQCGIPTVTPEIISSEIKKNVVLAWNKRQPSPSEEQDSVVPKKDLDNAIKEIGSLQVQLYEANDYIRDLHKQYNH